MRHDRLHNKIAASGLTLPVCLALATAMWWLPMGSADSGRLPGLALCMLAAYLNMETCSRWHLIRIRTRMMTSVWLILAASLPFMHPAGAPIVAAVCLCAACFMLFSTYQHHRPQASAFHALFMLALGSFWAPVMLPMAVAFFLYMAFFLRSLTQKSFCAGLLGLAVPYLFLGAGIILTKGTSLDGLLPAPGDLPLCRLWANPLQSPPFWLLPDDAELFSAAVIALLALAGIVHYMHSRYDDKIRVRMMLYIYVVQSLLLIAFLLLQPQHYATTMALLVASAVPLIAHCLSLSRGIGGLVFFLLALLLTAAMAVQNLCPVMP